MFSLAIDCIWFLIRRGFSASFFSLFYGSIRCLHGVIRPLPLETPRGNSL